MKKIIFNNLFVLFIAMALLSASAINAQEGEVPTKVISGVVVDDSGRPVSNTVLYNSFDEVVTGKDGEFSIKVPLTKDDRIVIDEEGYQLTIVKVTDGSIPQEEIVLRKSRPIDGSRVVSLPYQDFESWRSVSATNVILGEELASHPTTSVLEALSGRVPGLVIHNYNTQPGFEAVGATIRGIGALIYIDGILRDPSDLVVDEIEKVEVIKDFAGRAALGIVAANPVIFITTKSGVAHKTAIGASAEFGFRSPTLLPDYLDAYNYANLVNEAKQNDGLSPLYSQEKLDGYKSGTNSLRYPNIDYYDRFVKEYTPFRSANVNARGGDDFVQYFSMLDYVGTGGLEAVGQQSTSDRFKLRGNIDLQLTDFISMNVNLSGTYGDVKYPNADDGPNPFNMFPSVLSHYPSNAHALEYDGKLLQSANYPVNLINELKYGGYAERVDLNTQNSTKLMIDLNETLEGLSLYGKASFDVNNSITNNKGGTEDLYRHTIVDGEDNFERVVEKNVVTSLSSGADFYLRRTTINGGIDYNRQFNKHALTMNAVYLQMLEEVKVNSASYQPRKTQDVSLRANYAFDRRYVLQVDLNYSGNMKLPEGERFNLFPTIGAAWVLSNESFLENSGSINYLKLFASAGTMGVDNFYIQGYDQFYLHKTLWNDVGDWRPGVNGNFGDVVNVYEILQEGSGSYKIPKRNYLNVGVQSALFNKALSAEFNYFYMKDYDKISLMESRIPSLFGTGGFLPATNFGEESQWGLDGFLQYTKDIGDFNLSMGVNAAYAKGKFLVVDEPLALEEHRKLAGKATDLIWAYEADGLFQSAEEIADYNVTTSWGAVKPGDVRYVDYTKDGRVDAKDIYASGAHFPRINYGVNFSLSYKGLRLFVAGKGVADGETMLTNPNYFRVNSSTRNFSEPMLERWPNTNDYPRLTTSSPHSYQPSTFWLRKAAYFSLSNVELSYTLPRKASTSLLMKDTKFFARGANLHYFSDLTSYGVNPESINSGISRYPLLRTITIGVSAKF